MRPTAQDVELGAFLRVRRAALRPDDVEVPTYGRRRVPGLRREEVAFLAGVSASYYTRIEQGTAGAVSAAVLRAVVDVLRLDPDDRAQVGRLARVTLAPVPPALSARVLPSIASVMGHLDHLPIAVLGRGMRMLAWNRLAHRVFAGHRDLDEPSRPGGLNWAEVLLMDAESRSLFTDWPLVVEDAVGRLRVDAARHPEDPDLRALVSGLCATSAEFRAAWRRHPTRQRPLGGTRLDHPAMGRLELTDTVLRSVEDEDQVLLVFHSEPGSATEARLRAHASRKASSSAG